LLQYIYYYFTKIWPRNIVIYIAHAHIRSRYLPYSVRANLSSTRVRLTNIGTRAWNGAQAFDVNKNFNGTLTI